MRLLLGRSRPTWPVKFFNLFQQQRQRPYAASLSTGAAPLKVLFCGSDAFSAIALQRLHDESQKDNGFIESLDVVCKTPKPFGRGLKTVHDPPVKKLAQSLGLRVHEISTFTGWQPPTHDQPSSVIIAVSFGLKVPPRLLHGSEYGGINLHPSLLPDLRGPAPLQHALLRGDVKTGVTVQTLHPTRFDHGRILAQEAFDIPNQGRCGYNELLALAAAQGQDLLIGSLRDLQNRVHGAAEDPTVPTPQTVSEELSHAPKLTPDDSRVDWRTWDHARVLRTQRATGSLWSTHSLKHGALARIQWSDVKPVHLAGFGDHKPGQMLLLTASDSRGCTVRSLTNEVVGRTSITDLGSDIDCKDKAPLINMKLEARSGVPNFPAGDNKRIVAVACADGELISPRAVTVQGRKKNEDPAQVLPQLLLQSDL